MQTLLENEKIHVERFICENIDATHLRKEYVTLLGPRQVSKNTLSKRHYEAKLGGLCRDLEKSKNREEVGSGRDFLPDTRIVLSFLMKYKSVNVYFPAKKYIMMSSYSQRISFVSFCYLAPLV